LNVFSPKRWLQSFSNSSGRLTIDIALNGHFFTQIPHPVQSDSTITGFSFSNFMASMRLLTIGQKRWHSLPQRFGLHLSASNTATRVIIDSKLKETTCWL
jgi:hypothetical protein